MYTRGLSPVKKSGMWSHRALARRRRQGCSVAESVRRMVDFAHQLEKKCIRCAGRPFLRTDCSHNKLGTSATVHILRLKSRKQALRVPHILPPPHPSHRESDHLPQTALQTIGRSLTAVGKSKKEGANSTLIFFINYNLCVLLDGCLSRCKTCDRHAEWRAADIVETDSVEEVD